MGKWKHILARHHLLILVILSLASLSAYWLHTQFSSAADIQPSTLSSEVIKPQRWAMASSLYWLGKAIVDGEYQAYDNRKPLTSLSISPPSISPPSISPEGVYSDIHIIAASSGQIYKQVISGAEVDLLILADLTYLEKLIKHIENSEESHLLSASNQPLKPVKIGCAPLALGYQAKNPESAFQSPTSLLSLPKFSKLILPNPITAPAGAEAKKWLESQPQNKQQWQNIEQIHVRSASSAVLTLWAQGGGHSTATIVPMPLLKRAPRDDFGGRLNVIPLPETSVSYWGLSLTDRGRKSLDSLLTIIVSNSNKLDGLTAAEYCN